MPQEQFANPYVAAECGYVDAMIQLRDTRRRMIAAHGNRYKDSPEQHEKFPLCTRG
jgi:acetyl-CoA carboxylase carboxyltransferase component